MPQSYPSDEVGEDVNPSLNISANQLGNYMYEIDYITNFKITLLMPPSPEPENDFIVIKSYIASGDIDTCSLSISGITANVFTNLIVSQADVQSTSDLTFQLQSSSFVMSSDSVVIDFSGSDFVVTGINPSATFLGGVSGDRSISRSGDKLTISNIASHTLVNTDLAFVIKNI